MGRRAHELRGHRDELSRGEYYRKSPDKGEQNLRLSYITLRTLRTLKTHTQYIIQT